MRILNRHNRRALSAKAQSKNPQLDERECAAALRLAGALIESDPTVIGITLFTADGETTYISADLMHSGGEA
jgi:hypothetical protein